MAAGMPDDAIKGITGLSDEDLVLLRKSGTPT